MIKKIVSLSKQLISIPSTKENPKELKKILDLALKQVKEYRVEKFKKDNISSSLVYFGRKRPKRFKIILNAHLDVVPAKKNQYKPVIKNNRLYGRGAYDMKAASAVEILVFKELAEKLNYPLGLQLVTDEEIGGYHGIKHQIEKGVKADFILAGEPTDYSIGIKSKGIICCKVYSKGKSAHGAYPWKGKNALWELQSFLNKLKKAFPLPKKEVWKTTVNLARIETSNKTFNIVPDNASLWLDFRYIPEDKKTILSKIKRLLPVGFKLELIENEPEHQTSKENFFVKKLKTATEKIIKKPALLINKHGASDIRHFNQAGSSGVTFGPKGYGLHTDNEWVDIKSLENYYQILKKFLISLGNT